MMKCKEKRVYTRLIIVADPGVRCPGCGVRHGHTKAHKMGEVLQRMLCGGCGTAFVKRQTGGEG